FITGSRDATRNAFNVNLIEDGDTWMEMIKSRNLSSHLYDGEIVNDILEKITDSYYPLFVSFKDKMNKLID
ncbi:MAG: nucleotidyltransferase substrate binding protein, partial [Planctomycetaceae bacterium]|nr:nucleotidyltransferase substrate binding protein [Planctomycetaceae bacterium]